MRDTYGIGDDWIEIKGQEHVKRALEVAAAGGHNIFMPWTKNSSI